MKLRYWMHSGPGWQEYLIIDGGKRYRRIDNAGSHNLQRISKAQARALFNRIVGGEE